MKKLLFLVAIMFVFTLSACTEEQVDDQIDDDPQENPYQYLYDGGCDVSQVTTLVNRTLFTNLSREDVDAYMELDTENQCLIDDLIDAVKDAHAGEEYQEILVNRLIHASYDDAMLELELVKNALTLDVKAANFAIRADNVADYITVRDTYGLGGYYYRYFTLQNEWRYENQFIEVGQIVFIGSSVVEQHNFGQYFPNIGIVNRGIGGDYSDGELARLGVSVYDINPSKVFLYVGGNDYAQSRTPQQIADKVELIIQDLLEHFDAEQIYLLSVYPINEDKANTPHSNTQIEQQNALYETLASDYNITFADVSYALMDENGEMRSDYTSDGIHMNGTAYAALSEAMRPYIEE
jgi:lysophospholipase L1-like esterase